MARIKFLRRNTTKYLRLGKRRRKIQKWRAPKGRDNKMRLREKGYPRTVEIGYKKNKKLRGKIDGKTPIIINNVSELEKIKKDQAVIIGRVGGKKKIEIAKKASEMKIRIENLNVEKFIKNINQKKENKK